MLFFLIGVMITVVIIPILWPVLAMMLLVVWLHLTYRQSRWSRRR